MNNSGMINQLGTDEIKSILTENLAVVLNVDTEEIDENENLFRMGISSLDAIKILNKVKSKLNISFKMDVIFEHTTIAKLATFLCQLQQKSSNDDLQELMAIRRNRSNKLESYG